MKVFSFYLLLIFCLDGITLNATNYFVSPTGNDNNNGLTLPNAFLTLQQAADQVVAGDTVFVADGTYPTGFDHRGPNGTASQPIVFKTLGKSANITGPGPIRSDGINIENVDYIVIDGFSVIGMPAPGNGIRLVHANNCVVRNTFCDGNFERGIFTAFTDDILIEHNTSINAIDEHGIYVSNSSDRPIIRYNECYGNNNIGIHLNGDLSAGGDGIISDAQVYGNILHDNNRAAGINMDGLENPIVYNNLIYNNHTAQGIALFQEDGAIMTRGAKIYNNTIIVPSDGRWGILVKDGANEGTEIYNNIIINQHSFRGCIAIENQSNFKSDFNIINDKMSAIGDESAVPLATWQALGFDQNSQLAADLTAIFIDPANNDFHLKSGSQAIDAGTNLVNTIVGIDVEGNIRPSGTTYDIGAYELQGCPQNLTITTDYTTGSIIKSAANMVTATNTISGNANVTYTAGASISLMSGFEAITTKGASFHGLIQDCGVASFQSPIKARKSRNGLVNRQQTIDNLQLKIQPNPMNQEAQVQFYLQKAGIILLSMHDLYGQPVKTINQGFLEKGWHQTIFTKDNLPNGIYFLNLKQGNYQHSQKIIIFNN